MKTLSQMLTELSRPEVLEFAMVSDRLPCVKVGHRYEPVDSTARSTDAILEMLVMAGGSRYVDNLEGGAARWTARIDGGGVVEVQAVMNAGRVQARFVPTCRPVCEAPPVVDGAGTSPWAPSETHAGQGTELSDPAPFETRAERFSEVSDPILRAAIVAPAVVGRRVAAPTARPRPMAGDIGDEGLRELLGAARRAQASDVHLVAGRPVLMRRNGDLVPSGDPLDETELEQRLLCVVPERLRHTLEEQGSCDFALELSQQGRFRVNVSRQRTGYKGCFRCIAPGIPTLDSLGLPHEIERATRHHQGLVLVTGPTGHGKTTTLAAIVDIINRETTHHVITVEDPVEYVHPRKKAMISQREVGTHTRSFATALKGSLREDPDVIVVGELRDAETVRMALAASETGHLVIGTMNTPSAAKTIDRVVDLFPPADQQQVRMTLAGGLHLIIGQRLVPIAAGTGVVAAVELLPGSVALWSLIRDAKTFQIPSLQQRGKGFGILRLDESLADHVRANRITREVALEYAENPEDLDAALASANRPRPAADPVKRPQPATLLGKAGQMFGKRSS
ncbi:MAG: PilT/PilU family type 4a pilus ATPase [Polyangiaceae bacterium]|jgi:twitching motility protein PilT